MQLIDEGFGGWWKKFSAQALVAIGALQSAWLASPDLQALLSPQAMAGATATMAALGFVGRFIRQAQGPQ